MTAIEEMMEDIISKQDIMRLLLMYLELQFLYINYKRWMIEKQQFDDRSYRKKAGQVGKEMM